MQNLQLVFSITFFSVFVVYAVFGVYILRINWKSMLNRVFFAGCIALCLWSAGFAFAGEGARILAAADSNRERS